MLRTKTEKGREFSERFTTCDTLASPRKAVNLATLCGHLYARSVPKSLPFSFYNDFSIWKILSHRSPVGKGRQSVKLSRLWFRFESSNLSRCILKFVSETQAAECRSSKPNDAGSNPVAHSKFSKACSFNRQNVGLQNRNFQFKSERACQFSSNPLEEKRDFFVSSQTPFFFTEGKPNRCGSSFENCRVQTYRGSSPLPST